MGGGEGRGGRTDVRRVVPGHSVATPSRRKRASNSLAEGAQPMVTGGFVCALTGRGWQGNGFLGSGTGGRASPF